MLHGVITKHLTRSVFGRTFILLKYTADRNTDWIIAGLSENFLPLISFLMESFYNLKGKTNPCKIFETCKFWWGIISLSNSIETLKGPLQMWSSLAKSIVLQMHSTESHDISLKPCCLILLVTEIFGYSINGAKLFFSSHCLSLW